MFQRMGELLIQCGELTREQLDDVLAEQEHRYRPFGTIASELYGIHETAIWRAWSYQYARHCPRVHLADQHPDPAVRDVITPEQAWEYRLLPLRDQDGDLILLTTERRLAAVLHFADHHLDCPVMVWLVNDFHLLEDTLKQIYPGCNETALTGSSVGIMPGESC